MISMKTFHFPLTNFCDIESYNFTMENWDIVHASGERTSCLGVYRKSSEIRSDNENESGDNFQMRYISPIVENDLNSNF